jgi:hypothetical protein
VQEQKQPNQPIQPTETTIVPQQQKNSTSKLLILVLVIFCLLLLCILVAGGGFFLLSRNKETDNAQETPQTTQECTFNNKTYEDKESFQASDGCNVCRCSDGSISCTEVDCKKDSTTTTTSVQSVQTGTINGEVGGPPTDVPGPLTMKVCAANVANNKVQCTGNIQLTETAYTKGYSLELPVGEYQVYSFDTQYPNDKIYYDKMVTCGFEYGCPNDIIVVKVLAGQTLENINPTDWYTTH